MKKIILIVVTLLLFSSAPMRVEARAVQFQSYFAYLRHDNPSRTAVPGWPGNSCTPETVPTQVNRTGGRGNVSLPDAFWGFIDALNTDQAAKFLSYPPSGILFNRPLEPSWQDTGGQALMGTIGFGGNLVQVVEEYGQYVRVQTMDVYAQYDASVINFYSTPWIIHEFTVICKNGSVVLPGKGFLAFVPLIEKPGKTQWIKKDRVEPLPKLPMKVSILPTTTPHLNVRTCASTLCAKIAELKPNEIVTIVDYAPRGRNIWAQVENSGWIAIGLGGRFFTTWSVLTTPPPSLP